MHRIGIGSIKKHHVKFIPSMIQKMKKIIRESPKLIIEEMFLEKRKRHFGTFIFVNIDAFSSRERIPPLDESVKKENTIFPQKM